MITVETSRSNPVSEAVLFLFDDRTIPWSDNLHLTLVQAQMHSDNPVLRHGPEGSHDSIEAFCLGTMSRCPGHLLARFRRKRSLGQRALCRHGKMSASWQCGSVRLIRRGMVGNLG